MVADDNQPFPLDRYRYRLKINDKAVHNGPANLPHGVPFGSPYANWVARTYPVAQGAGFPLKVKMINTTTNVDFSFIALDWIEVHFAKCN
jgi:hypothetical protein